MASEGSENPKPKRSENTRTRRQVESNSSPSIKNRLLLAGQFLTAGTLVSLGGLYAAKNEDSVIGGFLNQNEPRNERFKTGQLFADEQLTSVNSSVSVEQG